MAEQQFTQEELGQEQAPQQVFDSLPPTQPEPKPKQTVTPAPALVQKQPGMFGAMEKISPATKQKAVKEEKVLPQQKEQPPVFLGNLSGAEEIFKSFATFDSAEKSGATVASSMIGMGVLVQPSQNVFPTQAAANEYMAGVKRNKAQSSTLKNQTIQQITDGKLFQKLTDHLFGSPEEIIQQGGKVNKFITKNSAGQDIIDPGLVRKELERVIGAKGNNGGRYMKEFFGSRVLSNDNLDVVLSIYKNRDKITKAMPTGTPKEQIQGYLTELKAKNASKLQGQIDVQDNLLNEKVDGIKQKYSSEINNIGLEYGSYWKTAELEVVRQNPELAAPFATADTDLLKRKVQETFDQKYAQYVMPKFKDVSDRMAADIKIEVGKVNNAIKRIYKENNEALNKEYQGWISTKNKEISDKFNKEVGSIIEEGVKSKRDESTAFAEAMINLSGNTGILGTAVTGRILGDTFTSAAGAFKNKTALILNALGFDADFIDEMRYSGKSTEVKYSMEKLPLEQNWLKPGYWAQSLAQSAPTMAIGMMTTALTGNPYVGGIVSFLSESVENSGGVMERVLENTGDLTAARLAGGETFIKNAPAVLSDILFQRMFSPLKVAKGTFKEKAKDLGVGMFAEGITERWQTAIEMSTGPDAKYTFGRAFGSKEAFNAQIEGAVSAGILGGGSVSLGGAYKALFDKKNIPSIRTQAIATTILTNGEAAAMAGVQLQALSDGVDDDTLGLGMKEVTDVAKIIEDAQQIGLNPQQTQVFTSLSKELADLNANLNTVTDPSVRKALQTQIAAKEKEIEGIISGKTPIATIELQPGLAFTGTVDGVRNVMNVPEVKAEVEAGNVNIITDDQGLNSEVEQARTAAKQAEEVPAEAAPVTEATPAVQAEMPVQINQQAAQNVNDILADIYRNEPGGRDNTLLEEGFANAPAALNRANAVGGNQYSAHGMGKTSIATAFRDLMTLLTNGIDPTRGGGRLYTAPLSVSVEDRAAMGAGVGTSGGNAYMDGPFTLVAERGVTSITDVSQIAGIIVNDGLVNARPELLNALRQSFPNIIFESTSNTDNLVKQLNDKYATKISERAQQEIPQPSDIVQRTGTQEGQPQVGQAEGAVGQTTQPAADTRNRNLGSQEEQIAATTKALDEKFVKGIESTIPTDIAVSMAEMQIPDMDSEEFRLLREDIAKNGIKKPIKITFYRGDNKYAVTDGNHRLIIAKELGIKNIPFEINESSAESKSAFPYAEYPEIYPSAKNPSKSLEEISSEYAKAKADGSNPELVKAVDDLIGQPTAPMAEAAPVTEAPMQVNELLDLDLKQPGNLEKAFNWLDNASNVLGKQIGSGKFYDIAGAAATGGLITARAIVQALRAAVGGAITLRDAIAKVAKDFKITEKDVTDAINKVAEVENAERLYSKPEIRGVITIANEEAANLKTTEKSSLVAYQKVFSTVQKAIQKIYDSGLIPEGASPQVMIQVTKGIARDAVNAAYPKREVTPKVTMSVRTYIADLLRQQSIAGKKISESSKEVRKVVSDIFKSMNKRFGTTIKYTDADFRKIMKEIEDAIFRKPITKENTDELVDNVNSIVEQAYIRGFEKDVRPKIAELVDSLMDAEMKRFDNVDAAAYSAFGKAVEYINKNQKEFKIKDIQPDDVLAQEINKKLNKLRKQEKVAQADAQVMSMFATPQVRSLVDAAQQTADDIVKANKSKKTGKTTSAQAYKTILSDLIKKINAMYARGNYPTGIPSITMVKAAAGIAQDAVNASFPRTEKLSIQEAEMVNMSARQYMSSLVSSQISAIGQLFKNSKKMTSGLKTMFKTMNAVFGRGMEMRTSEVSKIISEIQSVVFDKRPDLQTSMEEASREISSIVENAYRRKMIEEMGSLIDRLKTRLKTKYSGDLVPKITNIVSIANTDWDKSNATLEDINLFNTHLKQIVKGDNTKIDPALDVLNSVTVTNAQITKSEFDKLNTKLTNLNNKVKTGKLDLADLKDLITLQKAMANIAERKGAVGALSAEQQTQLQQKFDELRAKLPQPIEQLVQDKVAEVKDTVNARVAQMKSELMSTTSDLGKKIKSNDLHYQFVRMVDNYLTDDYINHLAETNPSKLVSLLSALDDIYNDGNYNNDAYLEYVSAIKYKLQKNFNEWADNLSKNRANFSSNGVVNAFKEVVRTLTDVEGGSVSPEAIKNNLATLRIHQYDVELTGKRDEFDMGILERDLFGPMAMHQEAAMNKTQPIIETLRTAMLSYADKSNHSVIKNAIRDVASKYGADLDVMFGKLKDLTKRGYQTRFLHDISVKMATIISHQIDDISNLAEGDEEIDIVLQRSIIGVKTDENGRPIYSDKTMEKHYSKPGTFKADVEQNYEKLTSAIAYAALTNNGTTTLAGLDKEQLLKLLTPKQREGLDVWRKVIQETEGLTETAMVITGNMKPFLNNYFPRRVQQDKAITEITDTEAYLNGDFEYGGLANNMLQSRRGNVGALDLDGNRVLFNNIKSLYLLTEVKPFLDYVKAIKEASQKAEADGDLFAARYLKGIELFATERLNANLLKNEKSLNETFGKLFKTIAGIQSFTAKSYLISVIRQVFLEYPLNVMKAGTAIAFANRTFPKQIWRLLGTGNLALETSKGKFEWKDYMKVVEFTGSQIARTMNLYPDNYVYEYSKSPEQLQREQKLMGWQDIRPKRFVWMNRFENAFKKITGEDFDHKAFEDERGVYRNMYLTAVEKASFLADATVDKQYGSSSFTRDPLRVNPGTAPVVGILTGTLVGGPVGTAVAVGTGAAGGFLSRGVRNLLNRIFKTDKAWFTVKKDNEAALVTGFLQGYGSTQHSSFVGDMKRAMSLNSGESASKRIEIASRGILESLLPSVGYVMTRAYTGLLFITATAVIMDADEEDKEEVRKNALNPDWWARQLYKTKERFKKQKEKVLNDLASGILTVALDPQSAYMIKMAGGLAMFKLWKEDAVEKLAEKGMTKKEINERKKQIKNIENIWFDVYNIRPIDIIHGEAYETALDRYYSSGEATKDWEETAMTITASQEIVQLTEFANTWNELRKNAVENKAIDEEELYTAAVLKAYSVLFTLNILGGKYGYLASMLTGDARKAANTMLKDLNAQQLDYEMKNKKKKRGGGGRALGTGGLGGGGALGTGGFGGGALGAGGF